MQDITHSNATAYDAGAEGWHTYAPTNMRHLYLEKPAMERELPADLTGKTVLCIGAGSGEELGTILAHNPQKVVATDISAKLLDIAHERYPEVECRVMDMMTLRPLPTPPLGKGREPRTPPPLQGGGWEGVVGPFPPTIFDLVYSSLAFHYANDWDILLEGVRRVMKPDGVLIFSTHHPGYWAKHPTGASHTNARGMKLTEHTATLPGGVGITYYNHPDTDSIREALTNANFTVAHAYAPSVVPVPLDTLTSIDRKKYKNLVKTNAETPLFWVVRGKTKPTLM